MTTEKNDVATTEDIEIKKLKERAMLRRKFFLRLSKDARESFLQHLLEKTRAR